MGSWLVIYKIYSLIQLSIKQLLLKDIFHHVSAHFYDAISRPEDGSIEMSRNM